MTLLSAMSWTGFAQLVLIILLLFLVASALIDRWHKAKWGAFDGEPHEGLRVERRR